MDYGPKIKMGFWRRFFMIIGIIASIFVLLIAAAVAYILIEQPLGINFSPPWQANQEPYDHPFLNQEQELFLQNIGIDPESIPTEITKEQEQCAFEALGAQRIQEIKSGATPSITEILKVKPCFE
jgi:hypothetical protein